MFQPNNLLVTGAAGFIGSHFVKHALKHWPDVRIISYDALTYAGSLERLRDLPDPARHTFVKGDIRDPALLRAVMRKHAIDTVVHFAAESHVDQSIANPAIFVETNVLGTFHLLEAARQYWLEENSWGATHCRFHHISTDEVFGSLGPNDPAFTETTPYQPNSPYSASKAGSDHLVRAYHHTYGLPVTMSNCSNNFGPWQHEEKFIPTVIRACIEQQPIPIYGSGANVRDWLYVGDHCDAVIKIIAEGVLGESYNIGGGCELDNLSLAQKICSIMDTLRSDVVKQHGSHVRLIEFVTDRPGHDFRYAIDGSKLRDSVGWLCCDQFDLRLRCAVQSIVANHAYVAV